MSSMTTAQSGATLFFDGKGYEAMLEYMSYAQPRMVSTIQYYGAFQQEQLRESNHAFLRRGDGHLLKDRWTAGILIYELHAVFFRQGGRRLHTE